MLSTPRNTSNGEPRESIDRLEPETYHIYLDSQDAFGSCVFKIGKEIVKDEYMFHDGHECCPYVNTFEPPQKARIYGIFRHSAFDTPRQNT